MRMLIAGPSVLGFLGLVACSGGEPKPARESCTLFEGESQRMPPGGVPVSLEAPAGWSRADGLDGSCQFTSTDGRRIRVSLEFCAADPCNAELPGGRGRATTDLRIAGQTLRTSTLRVQDPVTRYLVACKTYVQAARITPELDAELKRAAEACDTLAITSAR